MSPAAQLSQSNAVTYKYVALVANVTQPPQGDFTVYLQPTTHYTHALHEVLDCHILNNGACLGVSALVRFAFESGSARTRPLGNRMIRRVVGGVGRDEMEERKGIGDGGGDGGMWRWALAGERPFSKHVCVFNNCS